MTVISNLFSLLIGCALPSALAAADANWSLRTWQASDGLPDNNVTGIAQSADGYLWVATHGGLARFDGLRFEPWPLPVGTGISNTMVRVLGLGSDDQLWAGLETEGGLVVGLSDRTTDVFTTKGGVPQSKPQDMTLSSDGSIWMGVWSKYSAWDIEADRPVVCPSGSTGDFLRTCGSGFHGA